MAQHCSEAGLNEKAVGYWLKAGQRAVARSAMVEAVAQLQKGLDLLARQPDNASRQQQELDLQAALSSALIATMGYSAPEVGEVLTRASAIAEQINRVEYVLPLNYGQFLHHMIRAEHKLALSVAERMERVGNALGQPEGVLLSRHFRGVGHFMIGEFDVARTLFEQCHGLSEPAHRKASLAMTSEDSYALMLGWSALNLAHLGDPDEARLRADQMLVEARALQHSYTLAICLGHPPWIAGLANLPNEVRRYAQEMLDLANEHGFPWPLAIATGMLGRSRSGVGAATRGP